MSSVSNIGSLLTSYVTSTSNVNKTSQAQQTPQTTAVDTSAIQNVLQALQGSGLLAQNAETNSIPDNTKQALMDFMYTLNNAVNSQTSANQSSAYNTVSGLQNVIKQVNSNNSDAGYLSSLMQSDSSNSGDSSSSSDIASMLQADFSNLMTALNNNSKAGSSTPESAQLNNLLNYILTNTQSGKSQNISSVGSNLNISA